MRRKALVGITRGSGDNLPLSPELYIMCVERAGDTAEYIYTEQDALEVVGRYDGFIIPGGRDVYPSLYHEEPLCEMSFEEKKRVDFEISLLHGIIELNRPVLGICYGMQLLNIFFGGSLYQDINTQVAGSSAHRSGAHMLHVKRNPYIEEGCHNVPSSHHQAVRMLGNGLKAFAYAGDGIIEGYYHEEYLFAVGVQFHAERMAGRISEQLFTAFGKACHG